MKKALAVGFIAAVAAVVVAGVGVKIWAQPAAGAAAALPEVKAILTTAPQVPPPVDRQGNARVIVNLEMTEVTATLADGVKYTFWTFGGSVPGPFVRVRVGDIVQINLKNHHGQPQPALDRPARGHRSRRRRRGDPARPGQEGAFEFKTLNPGLYVYHCATPSVPMHIANGMYGLILVEPEKGLPRVDREYYVMQGEFYTKGKTLAPGDAAPTTMRRTGTSGPSTWSSTARWARSWATTRSRPSLGETVRLFVGNGGPNLVSSFHVIGEIFDAVYTEGAITGQPARNVQTTLVPAGGAVVVEMKMNVPGRYLLVDHSIVRAMDKGALGSIEVTGAEQPDVFKTLKPGMGGTGGH